ncbi:hypothetical protein D3C80_1948090 [compost metagenome]
MLYHYIPLPTKVAYIRVIPAGVITMDAREEMLDWLNQAEECEEFYDWHVI